MTYPFKVYRVCVDGHSFWVAECPTLKGCTGQGDTPDEAYAELAENERIWIETADKHGIPIPAVPSEVFSEYSGKFTVRVSPVVHKEAAEAASQQGVSLNQYVSDAIVSRNAQLATGSYLFDVVDKLVPNLRDLCRTLTSVRSTRSTGRTGDIVFSTTKNSVYRVANVYTN